MFVSTYHLKIEKILSSIVIWEVFSTRSALFVVDLAGVIAAVVVLQLSPPVNML